MSGEVKAKFAKGETTKVKKILESIASDGNYIAAPSIKELPENSKKSALLINRVDDVIELSYPTWDCLYGAAWGQALILALDKHFTLKKVGWAATGWCNTVDEFRDCGLVVMKGTDILEETFNYLFGMSSAKLYKIENDMLKEADRLVSEALNE